MAITFGGPEKISKTAVNVVRLKAPPSPVMPVAIEATYYLSTSSHLIQGCLLTARGKTWTRRSKTDPFAARKVDHLRT
jgi:hypothetical protein